MSALSIFAQAVPMEPETAGSLLRQLLQPGNMPFLVGMVAIVGWVVVTVVKSVIVHRERIAKIEQGIDPDAPLAKSMPTEPVQAEPEFNATEPYQSK